MDAGACSGGTRRGCDIPHRSCDVPNSPYVTALRVYIHTAISFLAGRVS
jgi:hypothetical protein